MTSAQVVETSVTNNSSFQNYPHPDDHTIRTTDTPGFKPFTNKNLLDKESPLISRLFDNTDFLHSTHKAVLPIISFSID